MDQGPVFEVRFRFSLAGGRPSGCYILYLRGAVQYVGQSENVFQRVNVHWTQIVRKKAGKWLKDEVIDPKKIVEFDEVEFIPLPLHQLNREENRLIQLLKPKYNVLLNRLTLIPGLERSPAFQDLLTKNQMAQRRAVK